MATNITHSSPELILYHGETWELMLRRWVKLEKDFKTANGKFDISKIPDIYDNIKYDLQHNQKVLQFDDAEEMYRVAKTVADVIVPQVSRRELLWVFLRELGLSHGFRGEVGLISRVCSAHGVVRWPVKYMRVLFWCRLSASLNVSEIRPVSYFSRPPTAKFPPLASVLARSGRTAWHSADFSSYLYLVQFYLGCGTKC